MGTYNIDWHSHHTMDINIPPALVGVQVNMYGVSGGGTSYTGIKHYRKRMSDHLHKEI